MSVREITSFIYHRDGRCCRYCGARLRRDEATVDHYLPKVMGGGNGRDNLRLACFPCNNLKADMHPQAWDALVVELRLRERVAQRQQHRSRHDERVALLQRCTPYWRAKFGSEGAS